MENKEENDLSEKAQVFLEINEDFLGNFGGDFLILVLESIIQQEKRIELDKEQLSRVKRYTKKIIKTASEYMKDEDYYLGGIKNPRIDVWKEILAVEIRKQQEFKRWAEEDRNDGPKARDCGYIGG